MEELLKYVNYPPTAKQLNAIMARYIEDFIQFPQCFESNSKMLVETLRLYKPDTYELFDCDAIYRTQAPMFVNIMSIVMKQYKYLIPQRYAPYLPMLLGSATYHLNTDIFDINLAMRDILHIIHNQDRFEYFTPTVDFIKTSDAELDVESIRDDFLTSVCCKASSLHDAFIIAYELYHNIIKCRFVHLIPDIKKVANSENLAQLIVSIHERDESHN